MPNNKAASTKTTSKKITSKKVASKKIAPKKIAPKKIAGKQKKKSDCIKWHNDNDNCDLDKNPDELSSLDILMNWLTQISNFSRYRGTNRSKETVLSELVTVYESYGILYRDSKGIRNKIDSMLKKYKDAVQWKSQTGQGILANVYCEDRERNEEIKKNTINSK